MTASDLSMPTSAAQLRFAPRDVLGYATVIAAIHAAGFGLMFFVIAPRQLHAGSTVLGMGLAVTAYLLGVRHAFDADHIAVIDNTTRKLMNSGARPAAGVGFWFAMGHSSVVLVMTALVALGVRAAATTMNGGNTVSEWLSLAGTLTSGLFLTLIGLLNLVTLRGIWTLTRTVRATGHLPEDELEHHLNQRGLLARILGPVGRRVTRAHHLFPVGLVMGLGFDTASEVALLVLAGTGAASGLPWYAVMVLPLTFAAGMTLFDFADGLVMTHAYRWAFTNPLRKLFYNLTVTAMSVAVALVIGGIELLAILNERLHLTDPVTSWAAGLDMGNVGFVVVAAFLTVWAGAYLMWRCWGRRPLPPTNPAAPEMTASPDGPRCTHNPRLTCETQQPGEMRG